jgi:hypothetical protein
MRKITEYAHEAFANNRNFKSINTNVIVEDNITKMYLHGNCIAKKDNGKLFISSGKYHATRTTANRLNGFNFVNLRISKGRFILNEKAWDGEWINVTNLVN